MAFTEAEETKLRAIITAFDDGQQVDDLPRGTSDVSDKSIEVFNSKTGQSEQMPLKEAVNMANAPYFERVWNTAVSTPLAAAWGGSLSMGQNLPDILKLGGYLVKNDHSRRKLDPTNHYRFENGETAKLDGSMGHYQWVHTVGGAHPQHLSCPFSLMKPHSPGLGSGCHWVRLR